MKFKETRLKGSADMERTRKCYGRNDGLTDGRIGEGHSIYPHPLRGGGLKSIKTSSTFTKGALCALHMLRRGAALRPHYNRN